MFAWARWQTNEPSFVPSWFASLFLRREDDVPIALHVHDRPTSCGGFVEALIQFTDVRLAVVGPFPFGVGVVNVETETRAAAGGGPLEHLEVAIGIAEGGDGTAADVMLDGGRFAGFVVDEVKLGQADDDGLAIAQFKL